MRVFDIFSFCLLNRLVPPQLPELDDRSVCISRMCGYFVEVSVSVIFVKTSACLLVIQFTSVDPFSKALYKCSLLLLLLLLIKYCNISFYN